MTTGASLCWHRNHTGVWHGYDASSAISLCRHVREPAGECVPQPPRGARTCRHCCGVLRRVRGPRHPEATTYALRIERTLMQRVPPLLRSWPPAIEITAPVADRLGALLLVWEITGAKDLTAEIQDTARELLDAWEFALERWTAQGRR